MSRPSALACFGRGLRLSLSKPYLGASLWLIQLLLAAALILPISRSLHENLDHATLADHMVGVPDYGWWETFQRTHPDLLGTLPKAAQEALSREGIQSESIAGLRGIGAAAFSLALLAIVLHAFTLGGVLGALREPSSSLVTFGREGMRRLPAFLAFTLAAFAGAAACYRWIYIETGLALKERTEELATEGQALALTALRLAALAAALAAIKLLADSVRAIWVARPDLPPVSRFLMGIGGALARPLRLLGVLFGYVLVTAGLYVVWILLDPPAGGEARFALVPLVATQQVFVFLRSLVKVGYYAAVSEALTRTPSPEYSYVPPPAVAPASAKAQGAHDGALERPSGGV
ncbi:MAG: hypothetical protein ACRD3M_03705 [Thermoanaerobaculia bacterium]